MRVSKLQTTTSFRIQISDSRAFRWRRFSCMFPMSTAYRSTGVTVGILRLGTISRIDVINDPDDFVYGSFVQVQDLNDVKSVLSLKSHRFRLSLNFTAFNFHHKQSYFPSFQQFHRSARLFPWPRNDFKFLSSAVLMIALFLCIFSTSHTREVARRKNRLRQRLSAHKASSKIWNAFNDSHGSHRATAFYSTTRMLAQGAAL